MNCPLTDFDCLTCDDECALIEKRKKEVNERFANGDVDLLERDHLLAELRADEVNHPMISIECPDCKLKHITPRCEDDPAEAVKAYIQCPECIGGGFGSTTYINAEGLELEPIHDSTCSTESHNG